MRFLFASLIVMLGLDSINDSKCAMMEGMESLAASSVSSVSWMSTASSSLNDIMDALRL